MQLPLQITYRHMDPSPALEQRIRQLAAELDHFSEHVMRCHVIVQSPPKHHHQGRLWEVTIDLTVPGAEIAIDRTHPQSHAHEDVYVALRDAFRAARRQLEDYERTHRPKVAAHVEPPHGRICELDFEQGYGRIETPQGRLVYFHRNSVVGASFDELSTGMEVRFAEEPGDLGPQASSLQVIAPHRRAEHPER